MKEQRQKIGKKILTWYLENKRDLPWRHTSDPYRIWISEIMLQQTRVDTAIDYYQRFLSRFPDVGTLASADEAEILSCWKGLGYYSRARNLHKAAKIIFEKYKGIFPQDFETLKALPGIGPYSAGAVLSIAFNIPYPAVDGNVLRVISRLIASMEDIGKESTRKKIADVVHQMMPEGNAGNFNQGLMDMGSMVCLPQNPGCPHCPVHLLCSTYEKGLQEEIPVRKKKAGPTPEILCRLAVVEGKEGILLEYRREETLLSRLWGSPWWKKQ